MTLINDHVLISKSEEPLYRCSTNIKHTDPVWSIKWQYEQVEGPFQVSLISISSDGLIKRWRVIKSELEAETILTLEDTELKKDNASSIGPVKGIYTRNRNVKLNFINSMWNLYRISSKV